MTRFSAVGVFCDDVREEKANTDTIVGIYPDNMNIAAVPSMLPKLAIYVRLHVDPSAPPSNVTLKIVLANAEEISLGNLNAVVAKASADAAKAGAPIAGIISRAVFAQFVISSLGRIVIVVTADGEDHVCGSLNFRMKEDGSTQPASNEQSASPFSEPAL